MTNKKPIVILAVIAVLLSLTAAYVNAANNEKTDREPAAEVAATYAGKPAYWMAATDFSNQYINGTAIVNGVNITTPNLPAGTYKLQIIFSSESANVAGNTLVVSALVDSAGASGPVWWNMDTTDTSYKTLTGQWITTVGAGVHTIKIQASGKGYLYYKDVSVILMT